jgi:hypothetical protein
MVYSGKLVCVFLLVCLVLSFHFFFYFCVKAGKIPQPAQRYNRRQNQNRKNNFHRNSNDQRIERKQQPAQRFNSIQNCHNYSNFILRCFLSLFLIYSHPFFFISFVYCSLFFCCLKTVKIYWRNIITTFYIPFPCYQNS